MTKFKIDPQAQQVTDLTHDVNKLQIAVQLLQEKQGTQVHRHEGVKECFTKLEQRLHALENFMLSSVERLAFLKNLYKFWPVLVVGLVICFSVGVVVDQKAVAAKIVNTVEDKSHELI
jgi:hypothetical protein